MAIYPKIQSPCPFKGNLSAIMDGDVCRLCKRQVHDITDMSDGERVAFISGCSEEVCVSYRVRPALAAAAIAVAALTAPIAASACDATDTVVVTAGGITDLKNVEYVQDPADNALPALPVVYESKDKHDEKTEPAINSPAGS